VLRSVDGTATDLSNTGGVADGQGMSPSPHTDTRTDCGSAHKTMGIQEKGIPNTDRRDNYIRDVGSRKRSPASRETGATTYMVSLWKQGGPNVGRGVGCSGSSDFIKHPKQQALRAWLEKKGNSGHSLVDVDLYDFIGGENRCSTSVKGAETACIQAVEPFGNSKAILMPAESPSE
jgi:hypothetical protein